MGLGGEFAGIFSHSQAPALKNFHVGCALRTINMRNSVYFWRVEGSGAIVSNFLLRKVPHAASRVTWYPRSAPKSCEEFGGTGVPRNKPVRTERRARCPPHRSFHNLWVGRRPMNDCLVNFLSMRNIHPLVVGSCAAEGGGATFS